jgi:hypothetical protein
MYTFAPDEKSSPVMIYTPATLVYGEMVTKQDIRVSTWLRTEGAPGYLHLLKPQIISLISSPPKVLTYSEIYLPNAQVVGYHLTPPAHDPLDYDENEQNRIMQPIIILVGTFILTGNLRISPKVDLGTSFSTARSAWMSVYDVKVSNPLLLQMGEVRVPMLVVRPGQVSFALQSP